MQLQTSCHSHGKEDSHVLLQVRDKIFKHCHQQQSELGIIFPSCWLLFDASMRQQRGSLVETALLAADGKLDIFKLQMELQIWDSRSTDSILIMSNCIFHSLVSQDYSFPGLSWLLYHPLQTTH